MSGTTLSYNVGDELTSITGASSTTSFAYNPNGNRISESSSTSATITYGYNADSQLTSISNPTLSASYSYNPAGLRSSATYNGVTSSFVYSPSDQLLADGENYYIYGPSGTPIEQISESSAVLTYLYSDQLGSVVMEADGSGNVVGTQSYSPYGTLASSTGNDPTPFGFAGGYTDPTGLIYLINRYYDPMTGQFVSVDPQVQSTGQAYSYAGDNPINNVDPTGRSTRTGCSIDLIVCLTVNYLHWWTDQTIWINSVWVYLAHGTNNSPCPIKAYAWSSNDPPRLSIPTIGPPWGTAPGHSAGFRPESIPPGGLAALWALGGSYNGLMFNQGTLMNGEIPAISSFPATVSVSFVSQFGSQQPEPCQSGSPGCIYEEGSGPGSGEG